VIRQEFLNETRRNLYLEQCGLSSLSSLPKRSPKEFTRIGFLYLLEHTGHVAGVASRVSATNHRGAGDGSRAHSPRDVEETTVKTRISSKSITVQTAPVLRRSPNRTEYALRVMQKPKQRDIGWWGIVRSECTSEKSARCDMLMRQIVCQSFFCTLQARGLDLCCAVLRGTLVRSLVPAKCSSGWLDEGE